MSALRAIASTIVIALVLFGALALRPGGVAPVGADPQATAEGRDQPSSGPRVVAVTPDPKEACKSVNVVRQVYADRSDPTIANRSGASVLVLVASVETIEAGRWNTPSGERPAAIDDIGPDNPDTSMIYRPVSISVQEAVRGTGVDNPTSVRWVGGQSGCDFAAIDSGTRVELVPGDRYVFFLGVSVDAGGKRSPDLMILEAWPISADDRVATPLEGNIPLSTLSKAVAAAPEFSDTAP